jgi:hypothetical protein
MTDVISIGVQSGGPKDGGFGKIKVDLYRLLKKHCKSTHCDAIDEYVPIFRIDGKLDQFGPESITRLRFAKKQRYITADIQVPEKIWLPKSKNEIRNYIAEKVREAITIFANRLKKDKHDVNEKNLFKEIDLAIKEFKTIDYESSS